MATISAGGIGSGLDVNNILEQIVQAEREPTENRLNFKETTLQAELSAFGTIKGAVSSFQSSLSRLSSESLFNASNATVSDNKILSASAASSAPEGSYSVEVKQLAKSHSLASIAFQNLDDEIGTGTLTFSFGNTDYDPGTDYATGDDTYNSFTRNTERSNQTVEIDSSSNTISGIRDAINEAAIGVTASIVDDGDGYRLIMTADDSGVNNGLEISVDEGGAPADNLDTSGLSVLAFNSSATNLEQTQAAQNAQITINGLAVSRDSNVINEAIPGVTLNLLKADIGSPVQVNVDSSNVEEAKAKIGGFVSAFNDLANLFNGLTKFGGEDGQNGLLLGDTTSRNMLQQIRREMGTFINNGGSYNSLSSIGITTKRDGTLEIDSTELVNALENDFDSVAQIFYASGNPTDSDITFKSSSSFTQEGKYAVSIGSLATQGSLTTEPVSGPINIDSTNNTFSLSVDGVSSNLISLSQGNYADLTELAREIQNRINEDTVLSANNLSVNVSYAAGAFQITSESYGSDSKISLASQNSALGFNDTAVINNGSNISGTIGGQPAIGEGRFLTGTADAAGLKLEISGSDIGGRGDVTFSRGIASKLDALLDEFLASNGQLTAKTESIQSQIDEISIARVELDARVNTIEERYRKQFVALDVLLGQLKITSDYLEQQINSLPTFGSSK